jgi:hypothetical protein
MTCKRVTTLTLVLAAALAGCGNYSNEDLEYMNAVPDRDALAANIPPSYVLPANEAELSRTTHDVVATFNGLLDIILGGVDVIRGFQPTQRLPNARIWGPVRAEREAGWQWRFVVDRDPAMPDQFTYAWQFQLIGAARDVWSNFVTGYFETAGGARRGIGAFHVETAMLRAAGFPFDAGGQRISTIDVTYSTREFPISVVVDFVQFTDFTFTATNTFHYEYGAQESGQGAMRFVITGADLIDGPMVDSLAVTTRWLASGAGRGEATVTQGDVAVGLQQVECWDTNFRATYNDKPWKPNENVGGDPSVCPDIPSF